MNTVPLYEAILPGCRRQCGDVGKSMHDLADYIEENWPKVLIEAPPNNCERDSKHWLLIKTQLIKLSLPNDERFSLAIKRINELAS